VAAHARSLDATRLITSAFNHMKYDKNTVTIDYPFSKVLDIHVVKDYLGWYTEWPAKPEEIVVAYCLQ
jgi:beta-glucuronidase